MVNMKKSLIILALAIMAVGCNEGETIKKTTTATLTFEDSAFSGGDGENNNTVNTSWWAQYIDSPQYGGSLLYGGNGYAWYDNSTTLSSKLPDSWGDGTFFGGGIAISNYVANPTEITYEDQLSIGSSPVSGSNFAVCYVASNDFPPYVEFKYGVGTIEQLYIIPTIYTNATVQKGNAFAQPMPQNGFIRIEATGINEAGTTTGTLQFYLYDGRGYNSWRKWSLTELGVIKRVEFRMFEGTTENGQRIDSTAEYPTYPFYFAIDDITVTK